MDKDELAQNLKDRHRDFCDLIDKFLRLFVAIIGRIGIQQIHHRLKTTASFTKLASIQLTACS
jgi:hypothetical protein